MIKAGTYKAKLLDCGLIQAKSGAPVVTLQMGFVDQDGVSKRLTWFGAMSGGAVDITVPTLVRMGFKSDNIADVANGIEMFNHEADYEIVVTLEPNPKKNNALEPRINFINLPGGSGFRNKMSKDDAVKMCVGFDFKADFMLARAKLGVAKPSTMSKMTEVETIEDLPF